MEANGLWTLIPRLPCTPEDRHFPGSEKKFGLLSLKNQRGWTCCSELSTRAELLTELGQKSCRHLILVCLYQRGQSL